MIVSHDNLINYLKSWIDGIRKTKNMNEMCFVATGGIDSTALALIISSIKPNVNINIIFPGFSVNKENILKIVLQEKYPENIFNFVNIEEAVTSSINREDAIFAYLSSFKTKNNLLVSPLNKNEYKFIKNFSIDVFDCYPFIDLYRGEIKEICKYFDVPEPLLHCAGRNEEILGIKYEELEWLDRENHGTNIIDSNDVPNVSRFWGIYDQRKKQIISKVYPINKKNKNITISEEKMCLVRKSLPGATS